ncbi:hypothetical protein [Chelativorans alearense]|uniref:hypothetical protein n=1 Tax=Chelativorans alearense TaxID=2681495 RepID=UPI0013D50465|nr:hypothetical protein [Chelativorans alearense]
MDVFSYQDEIYVARWNRAEPVTLHRLIGDRVEPHSGLLTERLRAADPGAGNISWTGDEAVVITTGDRKEGVINISVRYDSGQALKSFSIDLTDPMLR